MHVRASSAKTKAHARKNVASVAGKSSVANAKIITKKNLVERNQGVEAGVGEYERNHKPIKRKMGIHGMSRKISARARVKSAKL